MRIGFTNYTACRGFFPKGAWGMWVAVLVSLFSYFSIEMIAVAAGEAKNPQRAFMHAFRATMFRLALFYLLTLALVLFIVPWNIMASGATQSPFVTVVMRTHIAGAAGVVNFVILIAALSAMNSQLYITTRMLFSLSRARFAPCRRARSRATESPLPRCLSQPSVSVSQPSSTSAIMIDPPAHACDLDVRPNVYLSHDPCDTSQLSPPSRADKTPLPHVGLSLHQPSRRRAARRRHPYCPHFCTSDDEIAHTIHELHSIVNP